MDDQAVQAHGRGDESDLDEDERENAEPQLEVFGRHAEIERAQYRPEQRHGENDDRQAVEKTAEQHEQQQGEQQQGVGRKRVVLDGVREGLRQSCEREEGAEEVCGEQDEEDHRAGACCFGEDGEQVGSDVASGLCAVGGGEEVAEDGATAQCGGFAGRCPSCVESSDDERDDGEGGQNLQQCFSLLFGGDAGCLGSVVRIFACVEGCGRHVEHGGENAGDESGGEEFGDVRLCDDGEDDENDGGGNQDSQRSSDRQCCGGEASFVGVGSELRQGDASHRRSGGERGAAHGGEARASCKCCHGESSAFVSDDGARGAKEASA